MAKNKTNAVARSCPFLYTIILLLCLLVAKLLFRLKVVRDPALRQESGPLLILATHQSYLDPVFAAAAFPGRRIHFVAGRYLFEKPFTAWLFKALGVVAKQQMRADQATIRQMFQLAKRGQTLLLFPEGQRSLDGAASPIDAPITKLMKRLQLPVATIRLQGSYLCWPRWSASGPRLGKVCLESRLLFSRADLQQKSEDQLYSELAEALDYNEYEDQLARHRPRRYRGRRLAERVDVVLHACPNCERLFALESKGRRLFCTRCSLAVRMRSDGLFVSQGTERFFTSVHDWHVWQVEIWRQHLERIGGRFRFAADIRVRTPQADAPLKAAEVEVTKTGYHLLFDAETVMIPFGRHRALNSDYGDFFELIQGQTTYYIYPENRYLTVACLDTVLNQLGDVVID